jgi:hypothetical protein
MNRTLFSIFFSFFIIAAILSTATVYSAMNNGKATDTGMYGLWISAQKLSEQPSKFISLESPDSYVLQAILNPGESVHIGAWENTEIDNIVQTNQTNNIKYSDHYYMLTLVDGDPRPNANVFTIPLLLGGWIAWGSALAIAIIVLRKKRSNLSSITP